MQNQDLKAILDTIQENWSINPEAEITLEANPDDLNEKVLKLWQETGINRLSIGIQSLYDDELKWMNRAHNATEALSAIEKAKKAGFNQLTVDFIYGSEWMTDERWAKTLEWISKQQIPHISCYALTVEPKTPLAKKKRSILKVEEENEKQGRQFMMLMEAMNGAGYEHYEISNFALPGQRSRHNSGYWKGEYYLGIGPSAHSYNGVSRQWNIANNTKYIQEISNEIIPAEIETLSKTQKINEYILTNLRLKEGCDKERMTEHFGVEYLAQMEKNIKKYEDKGWIEVSAERFMLTDAGRLFADAIAADLFFSED